MKVRLWFPDTQSILISEIKEIKQTGKDVSIVTKDNVQYYVKNDSYHRIFEDAEKLGYIKNCRIDLD